MRPKKRDASAITPRASVPPGVLVASLPKSQPSSEEPTTYGLLEAVYADAISLQPRSLFYWASEAAVAALPALGAILIWLFALGLPLALSRPASEVIESASCFSLGALWGVAALVRALRLTLWGPRDSPLLLNRRTRKLYRCIVEPSHLRTGEPLGLLKGLSTRWLDAFAPWGVCLVEYEWETLEAELRRVSGQRYSVEVVWLSQRAPTGAAGGFVLAPLSSGLDQRRLWEHLRRYMEEGGPPLGVGERCAPAPPRGFFAGLIALGGGRWLALAVGVDLVFALAASLGLLDGWQRPPSSLGSFFARAFVPGCALFAANTFLALSALAGFAAQFGEEAELPDEVLAAAGPQLEPPP